MNTESKGIYHWSLGDVALARMSKKVLTRVRVIKDEKGLFYDDKLLGISCNEDGSLNITEELCYFVETCRTNEKLWLPYTCMYLTERSRPFYGVQKVSQAKETEPSPKTSPKENKPKADHILPLQANQPSKLNLNSEYDTHNVPTKIGKFDNAFREFVRLGKERLFDNYLRILEQDVTEHKNTLKYLMNANASTEDKFDMVIKHKVIEKQLDNYLKQCWRFNFVKWEMEIETTEIQEVLSDDSEDNDSQPRFSLEVSPVRVHVPWCLVCGKAGELQPCTDCAASFHQACRNNWLNTITHRKKTPEKTTTQVVMVHKIMSSTRTKSSLQTEDGKVGLCPSCQWGPKVGYDDMVWHKLGKCQWWPARLLTPGEVPACLRARNHDPNDWPLRYYGTLNHGWGARSRLCLFLPSHTAQLEAREVDLRDAVMDACDDYISVYLT